MSKHPETDRAFKGSHLETGFINEFCARLETERDEAEAALLELMTRHTAFNHDFDYQMKDCKECGLLKKHAPTITRARARRGK